MRKISYPTQIVLAVITGSLTGVVLGPKAHFLGESGSFVIQLLKILVTPLVFFAIADAFCKTQIQLRNGLKLLTLSSTNALVAGGIAFMVSKIFDQMVPAATEGMRSLATNQVAKSPALTIGDFRTQILNRPWDSFAPKNILEPFINGNTIAVILFAIFTGIAFKKLKASPRTKTGEIQSLETFFSAGLHLTSTLLHMLVSITPIAVFGVIARIVGGSGFQVFYSLAIFVGVVTLGIFLHGVVYYGLLLRIFGNRSPILFFKQTKNALLTALGTGSSMATLPVTLETLEEMKVSHESSRLAAVIGTNLNHDGILLYEAIAALFVAHLHGITLAGSQKILLFGMSALAAVGIAGIPDAGLITLSLVLTALDLPLTFVPLLLAVDWFLGRLRATANVTSDMTVATLLDHWKPRKPQTSRA